MGMPMPPSFRVGKRRLFIKSEVQKWLDAQTTGSLQSVTETQKSAANSIAHLLGGPAMT